MRAIVRDWIHDPDLEVVPGPPTHGPGATCERCIHSDLVYEPTARRWSHAVLHGLLAPIEEVLDQAVEDYLQADYAARLDDVDLYRSQLRTSARALVDRAIMHKRAQLMRATR